MVPAAVLTMPAIPPNRTPVAWSLRPLDPGSFVERFDPPAEATALMKNLGDALGLLPAR